ncbi:MAG: energy-coupled thiamine transporter ThiT, partial [Clostridia bacterium]|nr:energy-coupled thiamine transporter ThiT [Clostridia bacterium]
MSIAKLKNRRGIFCCGDFLGGTMENRNQTLKKISISAVMIAIGTVLSLFKFEGLWVLGGGVTFCAMLPLIVVSCRYGVRRGLWTAFIFGLLQALLGLDNIQYGSSYGYP